MRFLVFVVLLAVVGCSMSEEPRAPEGRRQAPVRVAVETVGASAIADTIEAVGTVRSWRPSSPSMCGKATASRRAASWSSSTTVT